MRSIPGERRYGRSLRARWSGEGEVLTFNLLEHPEATTCYAWEVDGRVTAVLGVGPVNSALRAVQASIMADEREVPEA